MQRAETIWIGIERDKEEKLLQSLVKIHTKVEATVDDGRPTITITLVNVYVDLVVFTRIAGTLKTGSGRYWC